MHTRLRRRRALTPFETLPSPPVGPYDELIYVPGLFSRRPRQPLRTGRTAAEPIEYFPSITRIYVSTDESVYNGRKNWGIPKCVSRSSVQFSGWAADLPSPSCELSLICI